MSFYVGQDVGVTHQIVTHQVAVISTVSVNLYPGQLKFFKDYAKEFVRVRDEFERLVDILRSLSEELALINVARASNLLQLAGGWIPRQPQATTESTTRDD